MGLVGTEDLREELGSERGDRCAQGDALADAAERPERDVVPSRLVVDAEALHPLVDLLVRLRHLQQPREVAFHVGGEHGDARRGELLGEDLEGDGLAGPRRAGYQTVAVRHREGDLHDRLGEHLAVAHPGAQHDRRTLGGVRLGDA